MSLTPGNKLSPFAKGINKSLLTPCPRVGLSKKRKTPKSINLSSDDFNNSKNIASLSVDTPTSKTTLVKRKTMVFDSPIEKYSKETTKKDSTAKKSLNNCFQNQETDHCIKENNIKTSPIKTKQLQSEVEHIQNDIYLKKKNINVKKPQELNNGPLTEISKEINQDINDVLLKNKKNRTEIIEIENRIAVPEENFCDTKPINEINDIINSTSSSSSNREILTSKICKQKHNEVSINNIKGNQTIVNLVTSSEEEINIVRKKKKYILSDDECDNFVERNPIKIKKKKLSDTKLNNKKSTELVKTPRTLLLASTSTFEDDEDAFTSTPDKEKDEKRELIDKIKELEKSIKNKKQKLDNLKRASIYKSKHNIEELKNITEKWREGCLSGLNGLLNQLQTQGYINMSTLLKNLNISDEMMSKLFIDNT